MTLPTAQNIQATATVPVFSDLNISERDVLPFIINTYGEQYITDYDRMVATGGGKSTRTETGENFENVPIWETIHVRNDVAAPAAGQPITFVLGVADVDTNGRSFPRVKQVISFPLGNGKHVNGVITLIENSPPEVTVKPLDGDLPALVAGQTLIISGQISSEGGNTILPLHSKLTPSSYQLQIIPENFTTTGSAMTEGSVITSLEIGGKNFVVVRGEKEMAQRLKIIVGATMLLSIRNTKNVVDPTNTKNPGAFFKSTDGAFAVCNMKGHRDPLPDTMSLAYWDDIADKLVQNRCDSRMIDLKHGFRFASKIENTLKDALKFTNASFVSNRYGVDEGMAVRMKFREFTKSMFTFVLDYQSCMSDPGIAGAPGYGYSDGALLIPQNQVQTKEGMVNPILLRYKQFGAYNRRYEMWRGGASGGNTTEYIGPDDISELQARMHIGFQFFGVKQWWHLYKPTN